MANSNISEEEFQTIRTKAEAVYAAFGAVRCPFLDVHIQFNAKGLDHIKFKQWNKARSRNDQIMRLKLLHLAPLVLKKSHTVQGVETGNKFERVKIHSRWEMKMTHVIYFEFITVLEKCRVRIIVKQINDSQPYFWSIIPYWKQSEFGKKLFSGLPESD
jgi:hypothetical protein